MKKVIITGPESSGKTTLFNQLTKFHRTEGVIEHAREYIDNLKREYNYQDILKIAKLQYVDEQKILSSNKQLLIADTDLLTLEIWCEIKYNKCHPFIPKSLLKNLPDMYILCYPDIPWENDPQRENPSDRMELFDIYEHKIKSLGVNYHILKGDESKRFENAKRIINKITI